MKTRFTFCLLLIVAMTSGAADITFEGSVDNDIAKAENWPNSTLPGADDLAIIGLSGDRPSVVCSADVSFRGIRVTNTGGCALQFLTNGTDTATITLGDLGFTNTVSISTKDVKSLFQVNFATVCAQTWKWLSVDGHNVEFYGTISGSSDLKICIGPYVNFRKDVGYGGKLEFCREQRYPTVAFYGKGKQAEELASDAGYAPISLAFSGAATLQEISPKLSVSTEAQSTGLRLGDSKTDLTINDGSIVANTGNDGRTVAGSVLRIEGTAKCTFAGYDGAIGLGRNTSMLGQTYLSGGELRTGASASYYKFMMYNTADNAANRFEQTGGKSHHPSLWIGGGTKGSAGGISEYVISGGITAITNASHKITNTKFNENPGLHISAEGGGTSARNPGILTMHGGELLTPFITFGHGMSVTGDTWSENAGSNWSQTQFALFQMDGGTLKTYSQGIRVGANWNVDANSNKVATAAGSYRVKFAGGTFSPLANVQLPVQCEVQPGSAPFAVDAKYAVDFVGPVWGTGALVKKGAKAMELRDAARFGGSLSVEAGTLSLYSVQTSVPATAPEGGEEWNADDLALEDGAKVATWLGSDGTAATNTASKAANAPKFVKDGCNGHSLVRFGGAGSLAVAAVDSPVSGQTDFTVALAFRTTSDGPTDATSHRGKDTAGLVGMRNSISTEASKQYNDFGVAWLKEGAVACALGGGYDLSTPKNITTSLFSRKPCRLNDGVMHVVVFSVNVSGGKVSQMVDGFWSENSTSITAARSKSYNLAFGAVSGKTSDQGYFTGDIATIRIYQKALTRNEMTQLTQFYCDRYDLLPLAHEEFAAADAKGGLGATNIAVSAGATLALPTTGTPFALASGRTLANAGSVTGPLELTDGAKISCVCGADPLPSYGAVTVKGMVTVEVPNETVTGGLLRQPLFAYESIDLANGQLVPVGENVDPKGHTILCTNGRAYLRRTSGIVLIVR